MPKKKTWIADLPEYADYLKELWERYPIGVEAWIHFSIEEMNLILKISKL